MACNSQTREIERWRGVQRGVQLTLARGEAGAGGSDCASHGRGMGEAWARHGRSFPIQVKQVGSLGGATVSGAPRRVDHEIAVMALAELCHLPTDQIALKSRCDQQADRGAF